MVCLKCAGPFQAELPPTLSVHVVGSVLWCVHFAASPVALLHTGVLLHGQLASR